MTELGRSVLRAGAGQTSVLSEGVNYLPRFMSLSALRHLLMHSIPL